MQAARGLLHRQAIPRPRANFPPGSGDAATSCGKEPKLQTQPVPKSWSKSPPTASATCRVHRLSLDLCTKETAAQPTSTFSLLAYEALYHEQTPLTLICFSPSAPIPTSKALIPMTAHTARHLGSTREQLVMRAAYIYMIVTLSSTLPLCPCIGLLSGFPQWPPTLLNPKAHKIS